jgi:pimeloyl-ACP methyl ester carboxylesterase
MAAIGLGGKLTSKVKALILEDPPLSTAQTERVVPSPHNRFAVMRDIILKDPSPGVIFRELKAAFPDDDNAAQRFRAKSLSQLDPGTLETVLEGRSSEGYDAEAFMRAIECPVLILQANPSLGSAMSDGEAESVTKLIRDCTLVRIEESGHDIHMTDPVGTLQRVLDFLESL